MDAGGRRRESRLLDAVLDDRFSAAANAWLAAISCFSAAESTGTIGGPDLLWWSYRKTLRLLISFRLPEPSCGRC
jgi:hypothetical protein